MRNTIIIILLSILCMAPLSKVKPLSIEENSNILPNRDVLKFVGTAIICSDINSKITCTITGGSGGQVNTVVPGNYITVNDTDPVNPIVSAISQTSGLATVASLTAHTTANGIDVHGLRTMATQTAADYSTTAQANALYSLISHTQDYSTITGTPVSAQTLTCTGTNKFYAYNSVSGTFTCAVDQTGGGTDLSGEPFVVSSLTTTLTNERALANGTNTTIDTGTAGQIKVNLSGTHADSFHTDAYSGVGTCTNQFARVLNDTAAPTCAGVGVNDFTANQGTTTQVLHGNAAGQPSWGGIVTADLPVIDISKGGTTETASTEDAVLVGASTTDWVPKVLPSCSNGTTSKLLYDNSTNTFSCGTDQTAAGAPLTSKVTTTYSNATTTGTEVTQLQVSLAAGITYRFSYFLLARNATVANAMDFGVNYTGTNGAFVARLSYNDTGTAATTGTADDVITGDGGELIVAQCVVTTKATTAPNLNCITAFTTIAGDHFIIIEGTLITGTAGDLELWAASESTTAATLSVGSNVIVTGF